MEVADLIQRARDRVQAAAEWLTQLQTTVLSAEKELADATLELTVLDQIVGRYGMTAQVDAPEPAVEPSPWLHLNRQEAVYKVLSEAARPLTNGEIIEALRGHGRTSDTLPLAGAAMAALKRKGLVESHTRGVWQIAGTSDTPADLMPMFGLQVDADREESEGTG
jgi:hypothetical protein